MLIPFLSFSHSQDMDNNNNNNNNNNGNNAAESNPSARVSSDNSGEKEGYTMAILKKVRSTFVSHDLDTVGMGNEPVRTCEESGGCEAVSTSDMENTDNLDSQSHWKGFIHMLKKGPKRFQSTLNPLTLTKLSRRKSRSARDTMIPMIPVLDSGMYCFKPSWKNFSLKELHDATKNFSREENLIGEGGYAEVYKGTLPDGNLVAIKRLIKGDIEEMAADFLSELGIIVHVSHPNTAQVIGYGVEGGLHLVLQLSPNGSLESLLQGSREKLLWEIRYKIALGSAEGLHYLHEGCHRRIIHRDIKSANILLSEDFDPQISDFGLAKWLPEQWTHHTVSKIEGTFGYLPPEFFMHGIVDEKTDVYAYGVVLLELITGRLALDSAQHSLVMWSKPLIEQNNLKALTDPVLGNAYDLDQMKLMILTASMCINQTSIQRPTMREVVEILKGEKNYDEMFQKTRKPSLRRSYSVELQDAEEYNSTKYLNDVDQLMQIALEI